MIELTFTGKVATWIAIILEGNPSLPFLEADIEKKAPGSQKRRDVTLVHKNGTIALTGEVKMPYAADGQSPLNDVVVDDARKKARRVGSDYFFTWNVNEFLLWQTDPPDNSQTQAFYAKWEIANVNTASQMELETTHRQIKDFLQGFLYEFKKILEGTSKIGEKSPDEIFIETVESFMKQPILDTYHALINLYKNKHFKRQIDNWMQNELGWTVSDNVDDIRDQLNRAAKFACYSLVIKIVFHEALLKRFGDQMHVLTVPEEVTTSEDLRLHLVAYFREAINATGDYETVFGEDHSAFGDTIPFKADTAVIHWKGLIEQIHRFDFSKMDYEVIGNIFERLIDPEERHKYGQYYTRVEVVDLINSFCIRTGAEKVLDPACGGGTFLVRAYVRKREKRPERKHEVRLKDLYGIDIERFAANLSTINLATRDLIGDENYPQVVRSDFFNITAGNSFMTLPARKPGSSGEIKHENVDIEGIDAIVTNPPYIRQEEIPKDRKKFYRSLVEQEQKIRTSGRSDIHVYFWPHAATFLNPGGRLGFITSSQWLDVDYGFGLQRWMLQNFRIVAIIESLDEPWFVGARVATTVAILELEPNEAKRMFNEVRFVQLRQPIRDLMPHDGSAVEAMRSAEALRDELLTYEQDQVNDRLRVKLVNQGDLWRDGVELGRLMGKSIDEEEGSADPLEQKGNYYGGKWGVHVRAPDLWFRLISAFSDKFVPLGSLAEVKRGVTSGKDEFFFPVVCTDELLNEVTDSSEFKQRFGVDRKSVEKGKVCLVSCGKGRKLIKPLEPEYLEPEVHSLMEISGYTAKPEECRRSILLVQTTERTKLPKYVRQYIEWGEAEGYHTGSTCASRVTATREWYDLTGHDKGKLFWSKSHQYRHVIASNPKSVQANCNLYDVHCLHEINWMLLGAILNSSIVLFSKLQFGRPIGVEGNLKTEIVDVNMLLVPEVRHATSKVKKLLIDAMKKLSKRSAMQFLSERRMRRMAYTKKGLEHKLEEFSDLCELDMPDRRELDDAVLELIGVTDKVERDKYIEELYDYLRWHFEETRKKEEKAIANKQRTAKRGQASPAEIAAQINQEIRDHHSWILHRYNPDLIRSVMPNVKIVEIPKNSSPDEVESVLEGFRVCFRKGRGKTVAIIEMPFESQAELVRLLSENGLSDIQRIPSSEEDSKRILQEYRDFLEKRSRKLDKLVSDRTIDEERQQKILDALSRMLPL